MANKRAPAASKPAADTTGQLKTAGYTPVHHTWFVRPRDLPPFTFQTIRAMLIDPGVRLNLATRAAPISSASFGYKQGETWTEGVQCKDAVVGKFIYRQLQRIWKNFLPAILRSQTWGWSAGEVTLRLSEYGLVEIDKLEPRHAGDCRLLMRDQKRYGVRVNRVEGKGTVDLPFPYAWFHAFNAEDGELYGTSSLLGAYSPWADKWFNGGALDVRRLFMHKDAYGGCTLEYPPGETYIDGQSAPVPNANIARQIVEQLQAGGVVTLPFEPDEKGTNKWKLDRATVASNPEHILSYPQHLDDEIRHGQEIPDDIVSSDGTGAWAGKRIPMAAFYASLDNWIVQIVNDLCEQLFDPLILLNWGKEAEYEIKHKPLAEQAMEQQANAGPGDGQEGSSGGFSGGSTFGGADPYRMSLLDPVEAVGRGALSVAGVVKAARLALDGPTAIKMSLAPKHEYSSTQFNLPAELAVAVRQLGQRIPDIALAQDGRESEPHITVKYGLLADSPEQLEEIVARFPPVAVRLGKTSVFPASESQTQRGGEQFDVVKIDVEGDAIRYLNSTISNAMPHFDSHPNYQPHVTIAYVKPGLGQAYADALTELEGTSVLFDQLVFSDKQGQKQLLPLKGSLSLDPHAD